MLYYKVYLTYVFNNYDIYQIIQLLKIIHFAYNQHHSSIHIKQYLFPQQSQKLYNLNNIQIKQLNPHHTQQQIPMQDSLQNLSPKRKSVSPSTKDDKQRILFQQTKQKFITALSKLQSSETRQIGIQEIRIIIDKNRQAQYLRLYLSIMKTLKVQGTSSSTKQHQILVFSILAQIYKQNLIDPIDKPNASRIKTTFRIIQILHSYFKQNTNTVQQACARVLIDLGKYVLGAQSEKPTLDTQTFVNLLFIPLASILKNGVDKASQSTASVCINQQIQYWKSHLNIQKYQQIINKICPEMLNVALKLNCQYQEIFMALQTIIQMKGLQFFNNKIVQFISKILGVINKINNNKTPQQANNFNNYMCKVNVCGILEKIGGLLRDKPEIKSKVDELDIVSSLEKATRNRVIQVQMAAARALKVWNGQTVTSQNKRPASSPKLPSVKNQLMSLEQARNQKKRQRSGSRQQKLKLERQLNYMQEDLNKLVKGGWGPHNRANNFVKKNTGVGGGYNSKMDQSASPKVNKSHKQHIQQLRKFIKQSTKEHGSKDKFVFYQQKQPNKNIKKSKSINHTNNQNRNLKNNSQQNSDKQMQFQLQQDHGDQMVNLGPYQNYKNPYADQNFTGKFDTEDRQWIQQNKDALKQIRSEDLDGVMDEKQMSQLLKEEQNILDIQSRQQIGSKISQGNKITPNSDQSGEMTFNKKQKLTSTQIKNKQQDKQNSKNYSQAKQKVKYEDDINNIKKNQNYKNITPLGYQNSNEQKPLNNKQEKYIQMKNNNTSNNSRNDLIPSQSVNKKLTNTVMLKNLPRSMRNIEQYQVSMDGVSNKMSDSIPIADIMNQSDFEGLGWNPFAKQNNVNNTVTATSGAQQMNFTKRKNSQPQTQMHNQQKNQQYKDSLVLSMSRGSKPPSKVISPPYKNRNTMNQSKKSQFTLNPKQQTKKQLNSKFNSFDQNNNNYSDDQILDESKYEQSLPYNQKLPKSQPQNPKKQKNFEDFYQKTVQHGEQLDQRAKKASTPAQQSSDQVYQQMIKNPPRSHIPHRLDKPSHINQLDVSQNKQQEVQYNENITCIWQRVLQHIQNNQLNQAYTLTFKMDDPIYLLRLMLITQTPLKKLTPANVRLLWQKFLQIYQHRFIDNIFVQMFTNANKLNGGKGLNKNLSIEQTNQLLIQLYQLSGRTKGKLSFSAASLYNQIQQSINNKNTRY